MKYLWTPYVCVLASLVVCDAALYTWVLKKISVPSKTIVSNVLSVPSKTVVSNVLLKFVLKNVLRFFWLIALCQVLK